MVDRHQLDRGDPKKLEVLDGRGVGEARVGASDLLGDAGIRVGEALDVRLVDDRLVPRCAQRLVVLPLEGRFDDHRLRDAWGRVGLVEGEVLVVHLADG